MRCAPGKAAKAVAGKKIPRFERTVPVRARPPAPRFALTGYAWRSHAKTVRAKRVRRSLSTSESEDGLLIQDGLIQGPYLPQTSLFEMRRLEMLSNTIFGVAMTLLAYDLPKASSFANAPRWIDLARVYAQPVIALAISFIVAGMFWFSHHRRLTVAPEASRGVVFLNLIFLLSIVILPVTNGLYGDYRLDSVVAVIYGLHLTVIAGSTRCYGFSRCEVAAIPSCWQTRSFRSSHSCSER